MSVSLQKKYSSNTMNEVKLQNKALKNAIIGITSDVYYKNALKNVISRLYPMDATRRVHKVNKYISKIHLSQERKYDIYAAVRLLEAFEAYENKAEIPQSSRKLVPIIALIISKINASFNYTMFTEVVEPTNEIPYSITLIPHKRLAVLNAESLDLQRINTKFKEAIPVIGVCVAEDPGSTCSRVCALMEVIAHDEDIDLIKREIGFFDKLQEQGQLRGIVETTDFNVIRDPYQEFSELHYVQPRGHTLRECMHKKDIRAQFPKLFLDIAYGLQEMHKRELAHFDVKIENIIILKTTPLEAGLTNLGRTVSSTEKLRERALYGTLRYTPVDVFERDYSLEDMDLFAFGLVTYMALHNKCFPWRKDLESGLNMILSEPNSSQWYDYISKAKESYKKTLEEEERLYAKSACHSHLLNRGTVKRTLSEEGKFFEINKFPHFRPLHRLSIDLLKKDTVLTVDDLVSRLEAMQISA